MDIGDVELKAEASILAKEVTAILVLIIRLVEMDNILRFFCFGFVSGLL